MTTKDMIVSISDSQKLFYKVELLESFVNPAFLKVNKEFNKVALNSKSKYEEIYLSGLEKQYYNFILRDYSYFQFNFLEKEDSESGFINPYARFTYFPNPFENFDDSLAEIYQWYNEDKIEFEDYSQALSESVPLNKRVSVRYDLSWKQFKKIYHPTAHYHFGLAENSRIATDKIFTPLTFSIFILNMYYSSSIQDHSDESFNLTLGFNKEIQKLNNIATFNTKENEYFCEIQNNSICIK